MNEALKQWFSNNVTFSLVLAVFTEVPRWVFAFEAINEPLWAGVPLAVLIAFATAHAWEEYFTEHDRLLLVLNMVSLVFAVFTIAPVLYTMIERVEDGAQVHLTVADVFPAFVQGAWVTVLACTTFLPLIQLAVVEAKRRSRTQPTITQLPEKSKRTKDVQPSVQPIAEPEPSAPPDNASTQIDDTQPISEPLLAQLDEMNERIVASIRNGNYTPYAISKDTGITITTLKRKKAKDSDEYTGRIPQLIEMGIIRNSSGADGSEYRLTWASR